MKSVFRLTSLAAAVFMLAGCSTMKMKSSLRKQLQMGGRYRVEVLSFDADRKKAWVKLWDKTHTGVTETPRCPYKYENHQWVPDPDAIFDMRPAIDDMEKTRIWNKGTD